MTNDDVLTCVLRSITLYKSVERVVPKPGSDGYGDHLLQAWSAGLIPAAKVGEYLNLNVVQVVELGLARALPQPWTATHEVQRYLESIKAEQAKKES